MAGWLTDKDCTDSDADRVELIDDNAEARAVFGENFSAFEFGLIQGQAEGLLAGKVDVFDINGREYVGFLSVKKQ